MNNIKKYKTTKKGQRNVLYNLTNNEGMYLVQLSIYCNVPQYPVDLVGELGWVRRLAHITIGRNPGYRKSFHQAYNPTRSHNWRVSRAWRQLGGPGRHPPGQEMGQKSIDMRYRTRLYVALSNSKGYCHVMNIFKSPKSQYVLFAC